MSKSDDFIYAVSRIRCKEGKLLSAKNLEQMISMKDVSSTERYLSENGWNLSAVGDNRDPLFEEESSLWKTMKDIVGDLSCFDFLRVQSDFHNLKACIKSVYSDCDPSSMFVTGSIVEPSVLYKAVVDKTYSALPEYLLEIAEEAMLALLHTKDGQLCDSIIDKACMKAVYSAGKNSSVSVIKQYCELFVAFANIKIAIRGARLHKPADFTQRCMAECETLNIKALSLASAKGFDEICDYLSTTEYKSAVSVIKESLTSFEKWCDNIIMDKFSLQKTNPFSIGPLIAYIIAKQSEIKAVRLILTAKANELDDSIIRERIRDMYV